MSIKNYFVNKPDREITCGYIVILFFSLLFQLADSFPSPSSLEGSIGASGFVRTSAFLTHPTFNTHHSETEIVRFALHESPPTDHLFFFFC